MNLDDEKQARRDLASVLRAKAQITEPFPYIQQMANAPVHTTLRAMGKQFRLAQDYGKREAIKGIMRLIVKHRFLAHLDDKSLKALLEEAAGLTNKVGA